MEKGGGQRPDVFIEVPEETPDPGADERNDLSHCPIVDPAHRAKKTKSLC